jgi:hypothetical protein
MKANELRIGNLTSAGVVNEILTDCFYVHDGESSLKSAWFDIQSIPLTEEYLLKFGFEKTKTEFFYKNRLSLLKRIKTESDYYVYINEELTRSITYVHQLQNLYFALTGCELEIK